MEHNIFTIESWGLRLADGAATWHVGVKFLVLEEALPRIEQNTPHDKCCYDEMVGAGFAGACAGSRRDGRKPQRVSSRSLKSALCAHISFGWLFVWWVTVNLYKKRGSSWVGGAPIRVIMLQVANEPEDQMMFRAFAPLAEK